MINLKICGNTEFEDIKSMYSLGISCFGFVVNFPKSPRFVDLEGVNLLAKRIKKELKHVFLVAVLVDPEGEEILNLDLKNIDAIQLHGKENLRKIKEIRKIIPKNLEIWKVFTLEKGFDPAKIENEIYNLKNEVDLFLFDVKKTKGFESAKHVFYDFDFIDKIIQKSFKIGIAGGIKPENINNFSKYCNRILLDVSSGVELSPGKKDLQKVKNIYDYINN